MLVLWIAKAIYFEILYLDQWFILLSKENTFSNMLVHWIAKGIVEILYLD